MTVSRKQSLALLASALLLPSCAAKAGAVRIGSTDSGENATVAEIYALALARAGLTIERYAKLGSPANAMAALERGDIDLFPGTAVAAGIRNDVVWLTPSGASDSPCLVTSQYFAEKFWMLTISECAQLASTLRLAASPDFLTPGGPLTGLRRRYGGLQFKSIIRCDPGTQWYAVGRGDAEIANASTTEPGISEERLVILDDDRHFWPRQYITPVVRAACVRVHPRMPMVLNRVSHALSQYALQQMNLHRRLLDLEPRDVAEEFLRRQVGVSPHETFAITPK